MYDAFIYSCDRADEFSIDCDSRITGDLVFHLKQYRLRSKVSITDVTPKWQVQAEWHPSSMAKANVSDQDLRCDWNMYRRLVRREHLTSNESDTISTDPIIYNTLRMLKGIPEGAREIVRGKAISVEYNLDLMRGIDLHKGCYLGQELVTRTLHRGVVRKRVIPVVFYDHHQPRDEFSPDPTKFIQGLEIDSPLMSTEPIDATNIREVTNIESRKSFGKLIALQGNVGLALARVEEIPPAGLFAAHRPHPSAAEPSFVLGKASMPSWWPSNRAPSATVPPARP